MHGKKSGMTLMKWWKKSRVMMSKHESYVEWVWGILQTSYRGQKIPLT